MQIAENTIHYHIEQQDGSLVEMTCGIHMLRFVQWVERHGGRDMEQPTVVEVTR